MSMMSTKVPPEWRHSFNEQEWAIHRIVVVVSYLYLLLAIIIHLSIFFGYQNWFEAR